ncbi:DUF420 domain-containing protein [Candidatus Bathyarchaeota archaeon]|nr:DUF420 domain-containing protein [Candidatus Bathyarchaeota archaeon]
MTGLFGTGASLEIDINVMIQVVMFLIIVVGLVYKRKRKFKMHGELMGIAVILHLLSFLIVMLPTFYADFDYFTMTTSDIIVQITWIHVIPGAIAMILGVFVVGAWALRPGNIAACSRKKRLMDIVTLLWFISLIFGVATYMVFYG